MNIVHRLAQTNRGIVFESYYGDKIHFTFDPNKLGNHDRHVYWVDVSPATELKVMQRLYKEVDPISADHCWNRIAPWCDQSITHSLLDIYRVLGAGEKSAVVCPMVPCKEDVSEVWEYAVDILKNTPDCFDMDLLDKYYRRASRLSSSRSQGKLIDRQDEKVKRLTEILREKEDFRFYRFDDMEPFPVSYCNFTLSVSGIHLISRFLLKKNISRELVEYMLSKVE